MGCIYKITNNINGKGYVGYTTTSFEERMRKHKNDDIKHNTLLGRAINKYGWDNFTKEIICESNNKNELCEILEPYYIKYFNTYKPNGYNMTLGGEKLYKENNPFYRRTHSEEVKQKLSEMASQRIGNKNPFYGKHHTQETKEKIKLKNSKSVCAYKNNKLVLSFNSLLEAGEWCKKNNLTKSSTPSSDICKCCKGKKQSAFGYNWKYLNESVETMADECKPVE